jgi:ABC-type branched-subunit amino acid transport system permease subunit
MRARTALSRPGRNKRAHPGRAAREAANIGLPHWIPLALGGTEALAALLFLVPAVRLFGGYALLFILAIAAIVHMLHGQYNVGSLVVYGMATCVCMSHQKDSRDVA